MRQSIDINFQKHASTIPAKTMGMSVVQTDSLTYVDSSLSCDTFNIIHVHSSPVAKRELETALQHFKGNQREFCLWVSDQNLDDSVLTLLSDLSLKEQNQEVGMLLSLAHYQPVSSEEHSNITVVDSLELLNDYSHVIAANWNPPDADVVAYYSKTSSSYLDDSSGIILMTYYHQSKPVATVELFPTDDKTVGVYGLATLEDARGQGIGSALMTFALNQAKSLGYEQVVLQASNDGLGIYQKLGFKQYSIYYEYA